MNAPRKQRPRNRTRKAPRPPRLVRQIAGRGDYSVDLLATTDPARRLEGKVDHIERMLSKTHVNSAPANIGRALGGLVGQSDLGAMAGTALSKLFGHGDYTVKSNSLMYAATLDMNPPKFSSHGKRGTRIIEREYLGDVITGAAGVFTNTSYNINPTDPTTFPWLSNIANLYEQWEPNGIVFEFVTTSSEFNGASQALGAVIMATDYDPTDPSYSTKQTMENSDYACSTKPSTSLVHGIECDPAERPLKLLYTNTSSVERTDSLGKFQIATAGVSVANVTLGELWISYDVTLFKKQISTALSITSGINTTFSATAGVPFLATTFQSQYALGIINADAGSTLRWQPSAQIGRYLVIFSTSSWQNEVFVPAPLGVIEVQPFVTAGLVVGGVKMWRYLVDLKESPIDTTGYKVSFPNKLAVLGYQWCSVIRVRPDFQI